MIPSEGERKERLLFPELLITVKEKELSIGALEAAYPMAIYRVLDQMLADNSVRVHWGKRCSLELKENLLA